MCSIPQRQSPRKIGRFEMLIEIDRKSEDDAVYYDCENDNFEEYITSKGFKTSYGSFSDISYIAPELGVAAVNLSSGYYNAHTLHEYINRKHLNKTIKRVLDIIEDCSQPHFPRYNYVEAPRSYYGRGYYNEALPMDMWGMYLELLDYYTREELEAIRHDYGDDAISELYEAEIGLYEDNEKIWWEG